MKRMYVEDFELQVCGVELTTEKKKLKEKEIWVQNIISSLCVF